MSIPGYRIPRGIKLQKVPFLPPKLPQKGREEALQGQTHISRKLHSQPNFAQLLRPPNALRGQSKHTQKIQDGGRPPF